MSGCANIGGIKEYAESSKNLTETKTVVTRWESSKKILADKQKNFKPDFEVKVRRTDATQANAEKASKELIKIHDVLAAYFKAVSELADDDVPSVTKQADALTDSVALIDPDFSDKDKSAFKAVVNLLSIPLDIYRKKKVLDLVEGQHDNVKLLLNVLADASDNIGDDIKGEKRFLISRYNELIGATADKSLKVLLRERISEIDEQYEPVLKSIQKYHKAINEIVKEHDKLAKARKLDKDQFKKFMEELKAVHKQLKDAKDAVEEAIDE